MCKSTIDMRRTLTIISVVIVLVGLGVWIYFAYFAKPAALVVAPSTNTALPDASQTTQINPTGATSVSTGTSSQPTSTPAVVTGPRLVKISDGPVVPSPLVYRSTSSSTPGAIVKYIERESGNVFSYSLSSRSSTRTSNRTIPGIQSAVWTKDGKSSLVRYLSGADSATINTYSLNADGSPGFFLEQNIQDLAVSDTKILALASGVNGSVASTHKIDGSVAKEVFSSPLSSLRAGFAGGNYFAFTRPSASLNGVLFLVDTSGLFARVAGPLKGLVALASPSGSSILVSYVVSGEMQMQLIDSKIGSVTQLPVATIADKCYWASDSKSVYCAVPVSPSSHYAYPDDWYQSAASFSDRIWRIDVANRYAELVLDFTKENKIQLDAISLSVDSAETAMAFINKIDGSLWVYSL